MGAAGDTAGAVSPSQRATTVANTPITGLLR